MGSNLENIVSPSTTYFWLISIKMITQKDTVVRIFTQYLKQSCLRYCVRLVLQEIIFLQNSQKFIKIFFDPAVVFTMSGTKSPHGFRFGKYSVPQYHLFLNNLHKNGCTKRPLIRIFTEYHKQLCLRYCLRLVLQEIIFLRNSQNFWRFSWTLNKRLLDKEYVVWYSDNSYRRELLKHAVCWCSNGILIKKSPAETRRFLAFSDNTCWTHCSLVFWQTSCWEQLLNTLLSGVLTDFLLAAAAEHTAVWCSDRLPAGSSWWTHCSLVFWQTSCWQQLLNTLLSGVLTDFLLAAAAEHTALWCWQTSCWQQLLITLLSSILTDLFLPTMPAYHTTL